jgi:hypothetical protein
MNRVLVVLATLALTIGTATAGRAQTAPAGGEDPFRFQLEQKEGPRGTAVEGYVYSALPWRITNVRLQIDSLDANGTRVASASGWVLGDVPARGRGYFYVPISRTAGTYRASVQTFDKVAPEAPLQAP